MINTITMSSVASYKTAATLATDKEINLIYGLNGTGKTTLSNFLYARDNSSFSNCSCSPLGDIEVIVYNQQFVDDHFWESDTIPGIFNLSQENKRAESQIQDAERDIQKNLTNQGAISEAIAKLESELEAQKDIAISKTWEIKTNYTGGDRVMEFCLDGLRGKRERLFAHISSLHKPEEPPTRTVQEVKRDVEALVDESLGPQEVILPLEFEQHDCEKNELFSKEILGNTETKVSKLIEALDNVDWVREGIRYIPEHLDENGAPCPFCQQITITESVRDDLVSYFDDEYERDTSKITSMLVRYKNEIEKVHELKKYEDHPFIANRLSDFRALYSKLTSRLHSNLSKMEAKARTPSQQETLESSRDDVAELNAFLAEVRTEILKHNESLEDRQGTLEKLKDEFWSIMRWDYDQTIQRYKDDVNQVTTRTKALNAELTSLTEAERALKRSVSDLQKSTINIDAAVEKINSRLKEIGIDDFRIEKFSERQYKLARDGQQIGDFKSLSEGEKTIISFLYFCELCKGKRDATDSVKEKIIVIDDPVSSLSHIFIFNVGHLIKSEFFNSPQFQQVFVLTHSLYFFYELTYRDHNTRHEKQKLIRLTKNTDGSGFSKMKYEEIQNDYQAYWAIVNDKSQSPVIIANTMRNIVEYFFGFIEKLQYHDVFKDAKLDSTRFQAFMRFIDRESHSSGTNVFDYKEFDYDLFREGLKLLFCNMGYEEHYNKMSRIGNH